MTTHEAAGKIIETKREWAAKQEAYRRSAGIPNGYTTDPAKYPAIREARALTVEKCAAVAAAHAEMLETRLNSGPYDELQRRRDVVMADLYRRTAVQYSELARLTRLRDPQEILGYFVLADQIAARELAGTQINTYFDWPIKDHTGTLGTQRWIIGNIAIDHEATITA